MENKDFKPEFANWNMFYNDLFTQITEIRSIGRSVVFNPSLVPSYFSAINSLFVTHSAYILKENEYSLKLENIRKTIFSPDYEKAVKEKNTKIKLLQMKILWDLDKIFSHMCKSFAIKGISVKVKEYSVDDGSNAVARGYN